MTTPQIQSTPRNQLRLWPGVLAVTLQWFTRFALPIFWPDGLEFCVLSGLAGGLLVLVWWAFFSRAPWVERLGGILLMIVAMGAASRIVDRSVATGMMGMMLPIYAIPVLSLAFVVWAVASRSLSDRNRRLAMVATVLLACGGWAFIRTNGITGDGASDFSWRWSKTAEERLQTAHASDKPTAALPVAVEAVKTPGDEAAVLPSAPVASSKREEPVAVVTKTGAGWPGFRGPHRDDNVPGVRIETDWTASPPVEMWRQPIGPAWSSFAVRGDRLYTQEQRGANEVVACYNVTTGKPIWIHEDAARFWESNAGAGPRSTPTLGAFGEDGNGRVYTFGATGIMNALDARNGAVVWSRNAASDTGIKVPEWGFASSPLIVDDIVVVAAEGKLAAYDIATGEPRWFGPNGRSGYSSPHLLVIDGVAQILLLSGPGATSVAAADGKVLWEYAMPPGARIVQPALMADGDILVSEGEGQPMHRIAVSHTSSGWAAEERWSSNGLKPYFSDFVVHGGHAFGFDGSILACIDLKDGKRKWKGGRYGHGKLLLLPDQDLLLVLSEEGELALVSTAPDQFKELARFPAIQGKTWNHPVLAGNVLLVRNGQEMAAFRLSLARR